MKDERSAICDDKMARVYFSREINCSIISRTNGALYEIIRVELKRVVLRKSRRKVKYLRGSEGAMDAVTPLRCLYNCM